MKSIIALSKAEVTPTRGPKVVPSQLVADADDRRRADHEAAGQIAVGLALAQVSHDQQRLAADGQLARTGRPLVAVPTKGVGEHGQRAAGHVHPGRVGQLVKLLVRRIDLGNRPSTRSFIRSSTPPPAGRPALAAETVGRVGLEPTT
jgi:hypothetical protein